MSYVTELSEMQSAFLMKCLPREKLIMVPTLRPTVLVRNLWIPVFENVSISPVHFIVEYIYIYISFYFIAIQGRHLYCAIHLHCTSYCVKNRASFELVLLTDAVLLLRVSHFASIKSYKTQSHNFEQIVNRDTSL